MNLLLITVDCLRADHVGFMGYPRPTTPNIDVLASQGVVLERAHVAGTPTYYSFPTIMASRYPLGLGRDVVGLPPETASLATVLKKAGYATAGFNAGNLYISRRFGYDRGFDTWEDFAPAPAAPREGQADQETQAPAGGRAARLKRKTNQTLAALANLLPGGRQLYGELYTNYCHWVALQKYRGHWERVRQYPAAAELTARALDWLNTRERAPFFLWLHYMDAHHPRYPSQAALAAIGARPLNAEREFFLNTMWLRSDVSPRYLDRYLSGFLALYDAGIREVDEQVGVLLDGLHRRGLREETAVVLLGDHGEELLEHGRLSHSPPQLTQELLHVPLVLSMPGVEPRRSSSLFGALDLAPTILEALGLARPDGFQGVSRWKGIVSNVPWSEPIIAEAINDCRNPSKMEERLGSRLLAVLDQHYKLVLDMASESERLFDLVADPEERRPLPVTQCPEVRRRLLQVARTHLESTRLNYRSPERLRGRIEDVRRRAALNSLSDPR